MADLLWEDAGVERERSAARQLQDLQEWIESTLFRAPTADSDAALANARRTGDRKGRRRQRSRECHASRWNGHWTRGTRADGTFYPVWISHELVDVRSQDARDDTLQSVTVSPKANAAHGCEFFYSFDDPTDPDAGVILAWTGCYPTRDPWNERAAERVDATRKAEARWKRLAFRMRRNGMSAGAIARVRRRLAMTGAFGLEGAVAPTIDRMSRREALARIRRTREGFDQAARERTERWDAILARRRAERAAAGRPVPLDAEGICTGAC